MNEDEKQRAQALIERLLTEAHEHAGKEKYKEALIAIRKARALDSANIYILAFERQVEQLNESTAAGTITDLQKTDILESLPGIIEQARVNQAPLTTPEAAGEERRPTPEQQEQLRAARQWLKNQYFQRAHEHVKNQEYDNALAELRRVFIIDSEDQFAREFELKILQMQELQRRKPLFVSDPSETEPDLPPSLADEPALPPPDKAQKGNRLLMIAMIIAVCVIAFAFYYFWKREQVAQPVVPEASEEIEESKADDEPFYPIPAGSQADSTKTDSTHTP
ncbi:MAG: hypothetical protein IT282_12010 [Bacteroidetes bacterium]|nr:hypothetical protein [Bacteroidota bacterium]